MIIETREVRRNGISFTMTLYVDQDASPFDYVNEGEEGCYTAEDIKGWRNDLWGYVGVEVRTTMAFAAAWSVEYGYLAGRHIGFDEIVESHGMDLLAEAYTDSSSIQA